MKIALVCPASLPATQFGGIMFLCVDIAKELSDQGHEIEIFTTDLDFANNAKTFNKKLPRIEQYDNYKINRTHPWFSYSLFFINPKIYSEIKNFHPDVIHSIGVRSFQSFVASMISKKENIPLIISDQGGLTTHPDLDNANTIKKFLFKLQEPMIKYIVNCATRISVANEYEKKIFETYCDSSKITIIRNGIDLEIQNKPISNFKKKYNIQNSFILFLGRFHTVKGIDILLKSIQLIQNDPLFLNVQLVIMGVDFGFQNQMLDMIKELKITEKVIVIKNPPRLDVLSAYKECEFLVLPSRWELSPLTPLEGFAFKKTVVSTISHGIPYTITHQKNGLLVEPENFKEFAESIIYLLKNKDKRDEFGLNGFNLVQELCNSKIMSKKTLELYEKVINR
jgi:glycosyltransferase involved in cell wall biosynthesis